MEYQPILLQVSLEADLGSEPGYISVRGVHVVPGYCHPLPPKATKGVVLFSLGNVLTNPDIFEIAFFFFFFYTNGSSVHRKPLSPLTETVSF